MRAAAPWPSKSTSAETHSSAKAQANEATMTTVLSSIAPLAPSWLASQGLGRPGGAVSCDVSCESAQRESVVCQSDAILQYEVAQRAFVATGRVTKKRAQLTNRLIIYVG
eukprot:6173950-Pleurochrysis_carterae.AAC.2